MPNQTVNTFLDMNTGLPVHAQINQHYVPRFAASYHLDETSQALAMGMATKIDIEALKEEYLAPSIFGLLSKNIKIVGEGENSVYSVYQQPVINVGPAMKFDTLGCLGDPKYCVDSGSELKRPEEFQLDEFAKSFRWCPDKPKPGCGQHPYYDMATSFQSTYAEHRDSIRQTVERLYMKYLYTPVASNLVIADFTSPTKTINDMDGNPITVIDRLKMFTDGAWYDNLTTTLPAPKAELARGHSTTDMTTSIDVVAGTVKTGGVDITADLPLASCTFASMGFEALVQMFGVVKTHLGKKFQKPSSSYKGTWAIVHPDRIPYQAQIDMRASLMGACADLTSLINKDMHTDGIVDGNEIFKVGADHVILSYDAPKDVVLVLPEIVRENMWLGMSPLKEWTRLPAECQSEDVIYNMRMTAGWFMPESWRQFVYKVTLPPVGCMTLPIV